MKIDLEVLDYTTLARRVRGLKIDFVANKPGCPINLILDGTGIKVVGEKRIDEASTWDKTKKDMA